MAVQVYHHGRPILEISSLHDDESEEEKFTSVSGDQLESLLDFLLKSQAIQFKFLIELEDAPKSSIIGYKSAELASNTLWNQIELEDALHWLSTLGGAYSNLGDHSLDFAQKAGTNAFKQMQVALRSPDPLVLFKCWLFVAMSLMQQMQYKQARKVIESVHYQVKTNYNQDKTLLCMCQGIWARLKYNWHRRRS